MTPKELLRRVFRARMYAWRQKLAGLDAAASSRVLKILAAGSKRIRAMVTAQLPDLLKTDYRKANIVLWTREITAPIAENVAGTVADAWGYAALNSIRAYNDILTFDGKAKAVQPVPENLEELKTLALGKPFREKNLAAMVDSIFTGGIGGALVATIDKAMNEGLGYEKIVRKALEQGLPKGQALTLNYAITVTRSYVQQASVNAQMAAYWKNRDVIKGLKWTAILDNRVCIQCAGLDGNEYLWEDPKPKMIAHPRCRCLWLPVVKSHRELGLDIDDLKEAERNWVLRENGNVDTGGRRIIDAGRTDKNFGGWWETLPEKEQIKSIGDIRTRLIREGKLKFSDLVDRDTGRVRTLKELGFSESGKALKGDIKEARQKSEWKVSHETKKWLRETIGKIEAGIFKPEGMRYQVGEFTQDIIEKIKEKGLNLETAAISVSDRDLAHFRRDAKVDPLPYEVLRNLPSVLEDPEYIYWDNQKPGVIYVFPVDDGLGKIIIQPNYKAGKGKKAKIVNNVRSGKIIKTLDELKDKVHFSNLK